MKRSPLLVGVLALPWQVAAVYGQGDLDPPPGPPTPTLKSLQEIEPRVDVSTLPGDANCHHLIEAPGSYYLTDNLAVTLSKGICIQSSGVTLDLGGLTVERAVGSGGVGIEVGSGLDCVAVTNGSIDGFGTGIFLRSVQACRLTGLRLHGGGTGIHFLGDCQANFVLDCAVTSTSGEGIEFATGTGQGVGGSCDANLIQRCRITKAGGSGIEFDASNTGAVRANAILDSSVAGTGPAKDGIVFSGGNAVLNANLVNRCTIEDAGGSGVEFGTLAASAHGNLVSDLTIAAPGEHGVNLLSVSNGSVRGNLVERVTVSDPAASCFNLQAVQGGSVNYNVVRDCVGRGSGETGLSCDGGPQGEAHGNRIEANHLSRPQSRLWQAIRTQNSAKNIILRNSAVGYSGYTFAPLDTAGPVVVTNLVLGSTGSDAHPAANFSR